MHLFLHASNRSAPCFDVNLAETQSCNWLELHKVTSDFFKIILSTEGIQPHEAIDSFNAHSSRHVEDVYRVFRTFKVAA